MTNMIINELKKVKNGGYSIYWLSDQIAPYLEELTQQEEIKIITSIPRKNRLALESRAKEIFFNKILSQKKYFFSNPLVLINPYRIAPLTALILFNTEKPSAIQYTIYGKNGGEDLVLKITEYKTEHRIPIAGLYQNTKNKIVLELTDIDGNKKVKKIYIRTHRIMEALDNVVSVSKKTTQTAEEYIYVSGGFSKKSYVFDSQGEVRFYFNIGVKLYGTHMLSNGHLLFPERSISNPTFSNPHSNVFHEVDFLGRVYKTYMVENGVHHYAAEMGEDGNILLATSTLEHKCGMENAVLELDRNTGDVIKILNLNEIIDVKYQTRHDWAHVNSIQYLPKDDAVILSLRNIHSVIKINWKSFDLEWILANPRFWAESYLYDKVLKPENEEIDWFYQQHAAEVTLSKDGCKEIILYDNNIATRRPVDYFVLTDYSFVDILYINENDFTVRMDKRFETKKSLVRSNGVLRKDKKRVFGMSASLVDKSAGYRGAVQEFDYETGELVNEYLLKNDFFSAYPIKFHVNQMSKAIDLDTLYECGHVVLPSEITREEALELGFYDTNVIADKEEYKNYIFNKLLLILERDNEIRNVYAIGKKHIYRLDKSKTDQRAFDTFGNAKYYITFPLENCAEDIYTFYIQTQETILKLNETIEIQR